MRTKTLIFWALLAVLVLWAVGAYNALIRRKNMIANAFGQIGHCRPHETAPTHGVGAAGLHQRLCLRLERR
jgi:hypothetical protein